ncbi:MAG: hypothetical protein HY209_06985 [Candidatus Omnitrophica bacterium]|nr:hypothetical protein [Candidatus Omnitrophota bacterium]
MYGFSGIDGSAVFRRRVLTTLFLLMTANLYAANPYHLGQVDYFHDRPITKDTEDQNQSFDWREPTVASDGHIASYTPPGPMLTLLENPTPENAKVYLAWQKQKVQKIFKAQELIDQVLKEGKPL